jgi:hypothetical protein
MTLSTVDNVKIFCFVLKNKSRTQDSPWPHTIERTAARHIHAARPGFDPAVDAPLHYPLSVLLKEKYSTQGKSSFLHFLLFFFRKLSSQECV